MLFTIIIIILLTIIIIIIIIITCIKVLNICSFSSHEGCSVFST